MKIAFFVPAFPTISETFIVNQIVGLLDAGHQVFIYAQSHINTNLVHPVIEDYKLLDKTIFIENVPKSRLKKIALLIKGFVKRPHCIGSWVSHFAANKIVHGLSIYDILPFLQVQQVDVVHAHFGNMGNYVMKLRNAGLFKKAKFITTFHGYDMMVKSSVYSNLFASDVNITVNSEYSKSQLLRLGCPIQKIKILPVGLNTNYFKRKNFQHQTFTLLFIGRLIALKGPDLFIDICKELVDRNKIEFKAVIIGDGELKNQLQAQIARLKLNSFVELAGAKTQAEIKTYMENADIFVLPGTIDNGRAETQGLVIQEAQAMQLPILISDAGGMKEGMKDGITGFVVEEKDKIGFADKIILLAQDNDLRKRMGQEGQVFSARNYDISILNTKLERIYKI